MRWSLLWEETGVYIRTATHTAVRDDDPDLGTLLESGTWDRHLTVRVWMAEAPEDPSEPWSARRFLGSLPIRGGAGLDCRAARRLLERLGRTAPAGQLSRLREELHAMLRGAVTPRDAVR